MVIRCGGEKGRRLFAKAEPDRKYKVQRVSYVGFDSLPAPASYPKGEIMRRIRQPPKEGLAWNGRIDKDISRTLHIAVHEAV